MVESARGQARTKPIRLISGTAIPDSSVANLGLDPRIIASRDPQRRLFHRNLHRPIGWS
jgi:hypothetical protein